MTTKTFTERADKALMVFGALLPADGKQLIKDLCRDADETRVRLEKLEQEINRIQTRVYPQ